ncbi:GNAT family N-acetyltransferase [Pengzhenrongella frigida]|uniref:GNAT family N-acetyltransferase n=1 Tax=Pengzhenrongella frigida TaxID=1259133 RepID=A0A4V1ZH65_9MICO|nr:GNAT family N-acetyltransferase [Cellulomonas sp. HLT2-17]RYV50964.1 GNAT family N-acetyltransferase [Cellulomonas sp. HLT2-17]
MNPAWQVHPVPVPDSLEDDDAWALHAMTDLDRLVNEAVWGHDDLAYPAAASLAKMRDEHYTRRAHLVAVSPDRPRDVVGAALVRLPQHGNSHLLEVDLLVHPEHEGHGVDDALLTATLASARAAGRSVVVLSSEHTREPAAGDPDALVAPTGSGRISRTDPGATLAERFGFTLEQAERYSLLPLPVAPERLAELHRSAAAHAGPDYRTLTWQDRCPDRWVDDYARLETRMSTDAPSAGLETAEDPWDEQRVRVAEAATAEAGRGSLVTVVEHVPTGTLAGFTMVEFPRQSPEIVFQQDTLVLREHRGRRLGLLIKAVNLEHLATLRPHARRLHTWNAEENAHMLAINIALGFVPVGVYGVWQKHVEAATHR